MAVILISVVAISCQIWLFSQTLLVSDLFPKQSAATVAGLVGAVGASGGLLMSLIAGPIIEKAGYIPVFMALACLHPIAAMMFWGARRHLTPVA